MSKGSFGFAAAVVALLVPAFALGQTIERVRIAGPGVTSAFPPGIALELASPPAYGRGSAGGGQGSWGGPAYWASGKRDLGGRASIRWNVKFSASSGSAKSIALAAPTRGWPVDKKDPISVAHYVGKRAVGTILGYYVITHAPAPSDGSYEAAIAFAVAPHAFSTVRFELRNPASDSAGQWGSFLVNGVDPPSVWNRGQALWALSGVRLLGNLPPTRVTLTHAGHVLNGTVADAFRHPVLRVPVSLQRRSGNAWRQLTKTKTNAKGAFAIRVGGRGAYRAVAVSRGKTVASPAVAFR